MSVQNLEFDTDDATFETGIDAALITDNEAVHFTSQVLSNSQKAQARTNIGAIDSSALSPYRTSAAQDIIDATKQDVISDLSTIRSGAAAGATAYQKPDTGVPKTDLSSGVQSSLNLADTALQSVPDTYRTAAAQDVIDATKQEVLVSGTNIKSINGQSVLGAGDISITAGVSSVNGKTGVVTLDADDVGALPDDTVIPSKTSQLTNDSGFINSSYLTPYATQTYVQNYHDNTKQNRISDLTTIRSGAYLGYTAIQPNDLATVATTGNYNDLLNKPTTVTESTVSGWGFTKNTGDYSKPVGGIPSSDMTSAVQTSLGKADTALQSVPSSYRTAAAQDIIDAGKQATLVSGTNIKSVNGQSILGSGDLSAGLVDDVKINGTSIITNKIAQIVYDTTLGSDSTNAATVTAIRNFVNSSVEAVAAYYITSNTSGAAFNTKALLDAGPWYYAGTLRTPTRNDYAIVVADETHSGQTARYAYVKADGAQTGQWDFQYTFNMSFTQAQIDALNSGVTAAKVALYDAHLINTSNPHSVDKTDVGLSNVDNVRQWSASNHPTTISGYGIVDSFSGNYNDLTNKPTIPTVNNATLTIQKNGTNVATFTANSSTDQTANIVVPTTATDIGAADGTKYASDGIHLDDSTVKNINVSANGTIDGSMSFICGANSRPSAGNLAYFPWLVSYLDASGILYPTIRGSGGCVIGNCKALSRARGTNGSVAIGGNNIIDLTSAGMALTIGTYNYVTATFCTALGRYLLAAYTGQQVFGTGNDNKAEDILEVGNGTVGDTEIERANAFRVTTSGYAIAQTGIGIENGDGTQTSVTAAQLAALLLLPSTKQDALVSGTNIKTINNQSLVGSGNISITSDVTSVNGHTGAVVLGTSEIGLAEFSASEIEAIWASV